MFQRLKSYYKSPASQRALEFLSDPSDHPALEKLDSYKIRLQLYVIPSFAPLVSWTFYSKSSDVYILRRALWDAVADSGPDTVDPTLLVADSTVEAGTIERYLARLAEMAVPVVKLKGAVGVGELMYGVRSVGFSQIVEVAWWSDPPVDCPGIVEWYHELMAIIEPTLPVDGSE